MNDKTRPPGAKQLRSRGLEVGMAALLALLATLVITDSLRVGIGWADDGPRSGYFPFYIGLALLGASGTVLVSALLRWRERSEVFASHAQLRTVFAMLWPMLVYAGAIAWLGIYLASFALIAFFMRRHGKFGWVASVIVSAAVPVTVFFVFERWFLVPLPKGPLEAWLGF